VEVRVYDGAGGLPHFNPELDAEGADAPSAVRELRELLIGADAVMISCPEYAHGVPGAFKNLLDWLVSTGELVGTPVALLNASPVGGDYAQAALLETLRTMNWRVVEEASRLAPFLPYRISGELHDEAILEPLRQAVGALVHAARANPRDGRL
jgi:NAD(P)H-dependent FMN reductase